MIRWLGLAAWTAIAAGAVVYALVWWPEPSVTIATPDLVLMVETVPELVPIVETVPVVVTATPAPTDTPSPIPTDQPMLTPYVWPTPTEDTSCYWKLQNGCIWQTPAAAPTNMPIGTFG